MSTRRSPYPYYCESILSRRRFVATIFFMILIASSQPLSASASGSASSSIALFSTTTLRHDPRLGLRHVDCRAPSSAYPSTATTITTLALPSVSASLTLMSHTMPKIAVDNFNCIQDDNDDNNTISDMRYNNGVQ